MPLYQLLNTNTAVNNTTGQRVVVPRYGMFDAPYGQGWEPPTYSRKTTFNPTNYAFNPRELTNNQKWQIANPPPPPLCQGQPLDLKDQSERSCFVSGMQQRLGPRLAKIKQGGVDGCNNDLQPHQETVYQLARALATKTPAELGGFRGMLVWHNTGSGKCLKNDTKLLAYDGSIITAGDLKPGMLLMGMDGTPRTVLDVGRGVEPMYEIRPVKGEPWACNESHVLSLKYNRQGKVVKSTFGTFPVYSVYWHETHGDRGAFRSKNFKTRDEAEAFAATIDLDHIVDIPLKEYLELPIYMRHYLTLFRAGRIEFPGATEPLWDPYVLGAWLGDGDSDRPEFTLGDAEIAREIEDRSPGLVMARGATNHHRRGARYRLRLPPTTTPRQRVNPFMAVLREYDLLHNKHIPRDIKCGSVQTRLDVLAGLLDTDGHLHANCYEITQKNQTLAEDIAFVARSLGFAAYVTQVQNTWAKPGGGDGAAGTHHKVSISGSGLEDIPVVLDRNTASTRGQIEDALRTGFDVVPLGMGEYVGPALDGDHRYLLWDFTVTHNTLTALGIALAFWNSKRRIVLATTVANEKDNNLKKYAQNLFEFFPAEAKQIFKGKPVPPTPWNRGHKAFKQWCAVDQHIVELTRKLKTYSFATFASDLGGKGRGFGRDKPMGDRLLMGGDTDASANGSVVIMDEVQSLFTPDPRYADATNYVLRKMQQPNIQQRMFVFALTATPGNNVKDMMNVLNFVRPLGTPAFTEADARDPSKFRGLVSYADIRGDKTRYGTATIKNIYVPMSTRYYAGFLKTITLNPADTDYVKYAQQADACTQKQNAKCKSMLTFMIKQRSAGDALVKSAVAGLYTDQELQALAKARPVPGAVVINESKQWRLLSDKVITALKTVNESAGKQYIWVAELNTCKVVSAALEAMGYAKVNGGTGAKGDFQRATEDGVAVLKPKAELMQAKKRFIFYKQGTAFGEDINESMLKGMADFFNDKANDNGQLCKVLLATETFYQGLDMRALKGVHLVDTLFNAAADKQAIGRALRMCGHSGVEDKRVQVYRYFSVPPGNFDPKALAEGVKGAAAKRALVAKAAVHTKLMAMPSKQVWAGAALPEGTSTNATKYAGVNMHVFAEAARYYKPVQDFELGLKAYAVDCPLFKDVYHRGEQFQCGQTPRPRPAMGVSNRNTSTRNVNAPASQQQRPQSKPSLLSRLFGRKSPAKSSPAKLSGRSRSSSGVSRSSSGVSRSSGGSSASGSAGGASSGARSSGGGSRSSGGGSRSSGGSRSGGSSTRLSFYGTPSMSLLTPIRTPSSRRNQSQRASRASQPSRRSNGRSNGLFNRVLTPIKSPARTPAAIKPAAPTRPAGRPPNSPRNAWGQSAPRVISLSSILGGSRSSRR